MACKDKKKSQTRPASQGKDKATTTATTKAPSNSFHSVSVKLDGQNLGDVHVTSEIPVREMTMLAGAKAWRKLEAGKGDTRMYTLHLQSPALKDADLYLTTTEGQVALVTGKEKTARNAGFEWINIVTVEPAAVTAEPIAKVQIGNQTMSINKQKWKEWFPNDRGMGQPATDFIDKLTSDNFDKVTFRGPEGVVSLDRKQLADHKAKLSGRGLLKLKAVNPGAKDSVVVGDIQSIDIN